MKSFTEGLVRRMGRKVGGVIRRCGMKRTSCRIKSKVRLAAQGEQVPGMRCSI